MVGSVLSQGLRLHKADSLTSRCPACQQKLGHVNVSKFGITVSCVCLQAKSLADFLLPMLEYVPIKRATAEQMLRHPWLHDVSGYQPEPRDGQYKKDVRRDRSSSDPGHVVAKRSRCAVSIKCAVVC